MQLQSRYILNARTGISDGTITNSFETRRTKIKAAGKLGDPRFRYTVTMAFSRSTWIASSEDVHMRIKLADNWTLRVGKFRPTVLREQAISSKYQLGAERSLLTSAFGQSYTQGLSLMYRKDQLRITASAMDAEASFAGDQVWEYIIRSELMLSGPRSAMSDFTSFRTDEPATMIGAGIGYRESDPANPATMDSSTRSWSVDLTAEFGGSSCFIALIGSQFDEQGAPGVDRFGLLVQGGIFVNDKTELFARHAHGDDETSASLNLVEVGLNYSEHEHNAKFTTDMGYSFDEVTTAWRSAGAGWRPDAAGGAGLRVALACAMLNDPPILLIDQPEIGLTRTEIEGLAQWVERESQHRPVVVVVATNKRWIKPLATKIIRLEG